MSRNLESLEEKVALSKKEEYKEGAYEELALLKEKVEQALKFVGVWPPTQPEEARVIEQSAQPANADITRQSVKVGVEEPEQFLPQFLSKIRRSCSHIASLIKGLVNTIFLFVSKLFFTFVSMPMNRLYTRIRMMNNNNPIVNC